MRLRNLAVVVMVLSGVLNASAAAETRSLLDQDVTSTPMADRMIKLEVVLQAPVERVWQAWTTREGITSFFAPDCNIDLRVLGKYEILFAPQAPPGRRGAEGNLILAIQEGKMLSFTWDAPPMFPDIRQQRTSVVIRLVPVDKQTTRLIFRQSGWGDGENWDKAYDYFVQAWGEQVLPYLKHSLEVGPIDWKNPPQKLAKVVQS